MNYEGLTREERKKLAYHRRGVYALFGGDLFIMPDDDDTILTTGIRRCT